MLAARGDTSVVAPPAPDVPRTPDDEYSVVVHGIPEDSVVAPGVPEFAHF